MRLPNLFLLGAAKCGTTSLANWLQQHPLMHVAPSKEPTFFCRHLFEIKTLGIDSEASEAILPLRIFRSAIP